MIVDILLFRGVKTCYSYRYNGDDTIVGKTVEVPLGRAKAKGLVVKQREGGDDSLKFVLEIDESKPLVPQPLIDLMSWFAEYYQCTPYKAYQTIVGNKKLREVSAPENTDITPPDYELNAEQKEVLAGILHAPKSFQEFYIHGVTGSGKTEVYMHVATQLLAEKKKTLILVPEIALTPQYTDIFKHRFGDIISVIHSGLTPKQRDIEWNRILEGHAQIVIGPRSAVFTPLDNIGAVIIDEEHEPSYKQENHPRYDTHTIAKFRANYHDCWMIYASATPRIETYYAAQNRMSLLTLPNRVNKTPLPTVRLVDMAEAYRIGEGGILSRELENAIKIRLEKKEKVIILINRRGFSTYVACQKCGTVHSCDQCDLSYTYHDDKSFRCHRCGILTGVTHTCKKCGSNRLAFTGVGIQKVVLELQRSFGDASIIRLDKDTAKTTKQLSKLLDEFKSSGDILVGTQLIAKGHHIEAVTLVGVIGIDTVLNMPDFRSSERTYQLLSQVAGRAGRGTIQGEVIIQTSQTEHPIMEHVIQHDYNSFYHMECTYRKELSYPPYGSLVHIILSTKNKRDLQTYAFELKTALSRYQEEMDFGFRFIGPKPAPIEMIRHHYRWDVVIKCDTESMQELKDKLLTLPLPPKTLRLILDYDPYTLL